MQAGQLRQRVIFQKPVVTFPDGYRTVTWEDDFTVPCRARELTETLGEFLIRYRTTSDADGNEIPISAKTHRIIWRGKIWHITNAPPDDKNTELLITADFSMMVDSTDLTDEHQEFLTGVPLTRPTEGEGNL